MYAFFLAVEIAALLPHLLRNFFLLWAL